MSVIDRIYEKIKLEEGKLIIEKFFLELYFEERMSTKDLSQKLLIPIPLVTAIKKESIKENMIEQNNGISLSTEGKDFVENLLGYKGINKKAYKSILNKSNELLLSEIKKDIEIIFKNRPLVDVTLDQSKCTVETAINRVIIGLANNSIIGKKILCIGDDDLISVTINIILKKLFDNNVPYNTKIYVYDKDNRILDYIRTMSEIFELSCIACKKLDMKNKLEKENISVFDTIFTDPPYTINGLELFLTRAVESIKKESGLFIFLSFAHKSQDAMYKLENKILNLGLSIYQIIPCFNEYEGAEILGNKGQLIMLQTTREVSNKRSIDYLNLIYTGEIRQTKRKYKCKNCGKEIFVGLEEKYTTIEELKEKKCPICHTQIFDLIEKIRKE